MISIFTLLLTLICLGAWYWLYHIVYETSWHPIIKFIVMLFVTVFIIAIALLSIFIYCLPQQVPKK
jgi:hypothetical protein